MSLLFIHGVNNRNTDEGYLNFHGMRRSMTNNLVVAALKKQYSDFDQCDDAYWGDLGVKFDWDLESIPEVKLIGHLGGEDGQDYPENKALMIMMTESGTSSLSDLVQKVEPSLVFSALIEPLLIAPDTTKAVSNEKPMVDKQAIENTAIAQAYLIQAAEQLAADKNFLDQLKMQSTTKDFLDVFHAELVNLANEIAEKNTVAPGKIATPGSKEVDTLGINDLFSNLNAVTNKLRENAEKVVSTIKENTIDKSSRAASLAALEWQRTDKSRTALLFFGDVFEYLRRGWSKQPQENITTRVAKSIEAAFLKSKERNEPFVIVTHSFGSMILFDILTSYKFNQQIEVDLWFMAGAQVSLFAEMRLFANSGSVPGAGRPILPKPKQVKRWVNFYDQADIFSYLSTPVFGDQVLDIEFKQNANIKTAHGDYFAQPAFYAQLLDEIRKSVNAKTEV